jgi:uncharacterized Zn-binding protein involved in type VI secretion
MREASDHSRVTPEGKAMGFEMVRLTEPIIAELERKGVPDERCKSCAFRLGTVPNGCPQTQMDALKAVVEGGKFDCHQHDRRGTFCFGWAAARASVARASVAKGVSPFGTCPWDYSPPDDAPPTAVGGQGDKP